MANEIYSINPEDYRDLWQEARDKARQAAERLGSDERDQLSIIVIKPSAAVPVATLDGQDIVPGVGSAAFLWLDTSSTPKLATNSSGGVTVYNLSQTTEGATDQAYAAWYVNGSIFFSPGGTTSGGVLVKATTLEQIDPLRSGNIQLFDEPVGTYVGYWEWAHNGQSIPISTEVWAQQRSGNEYDIVHPATQASFTSACINCIPNSQNAAAPIWVDGIFSLLPSPPAEAQQAIGYWNGTHYVTGGLPNNNPCEPSEFGGQAAGENLYVEWLVRDTRVDGPSVRLTWGTYSTTWGLGPLSDPYDCSVLRFLDQSNRITTGTGNELDDIPGWSLNMDNIIIEINTTQ